MKLRIVAAACIAVAWSAVLVLFAIAGQLMSLDEEWHGWGDILLNPYLMMPLGIFTVGVGLAEYWMLRPLMAKGSPKDG